MGCKCKESVLKMVKVGYTFKLRYAYEDDLDIISYKSIPDMLSGENAAAKGNSILSGMPIPIYITKLLWVYKTPTCFNLNCS